MDKRSPDEISKSIQSLVEEAENVEVQAESDNEDLAKENQEKSKLDNVSGELEKKYKKNITQKKIGTSNSEIDLDLSGLISDDVALAVRAELMRFSDVFDTDDTKEIIYKSVTNATR